MVSLQTKPLPLSKTTSIMFELPNSCSFISQVCLIKVKCSRLQRRDYDYLTMANSFLDSESVVEWSACSEVTIADPRSGGLAKTIVRTQSLK
jgi:hypothetical protein